MQKAIDPTMMATDLADYLVDPGVPFREAHAMAGRAVRAAGEINLSLAEMPLEVYQAICPFEADVYQVYRSTEVHPKEKRDWRHESPVGQKPNSQNQRSLNHVYC